MMKSFLYGSGFAHILKSVTIPENRNECTVLGQRDRDTRSKRARAVAAKKKKGQRIGPGSRKGPKYSRLSKKDRWISKIRVQRKFLKQLRDEDYIDTSTYRKLYLQSKGGLFRSVRYLRNYITEHGLAKKRLPEL